MSVSRKTLGGILCLGLGSASLISQARPSQDITRVTAFEGNLPNLPGQRISGFLVTYGPGARSRPHHHTERGSVMVYVLEGEVRSQVNSGPVTSYKAGESWQEPPGAAHRVAENASARKPARLLAIFVADSGAVLTTVDSLP